MSIVSIVADSVQPQAATRARPVRDDGLDRLVAVLPWLDHDGRMARLALVPAGFLPVTLIAASTFGVVGLKVLALGCLLPVVAAVAMLAARQRPIRLRIGAALLAGFLATGLYDIVRLSFIGLHLIGHDPIPHIGVALGLQPAWVFGYLWRYLGNGGGLAIAFSALGFRGVGKGVLFGLFVCAGLIVVLIVSPHAQQVLFTLTVPSVIMMTLGHAVYGGVLGALSARAREPIAYRASSNLGAGRGRGHGIVGGLRAPPESAAPGRGREDGAMVDEIEDPRRSEPDFLLPEREMLEGWIEFHRTTLLLKCEGLDDAGRKSRPVPTSKLSLHGLVRHMAEVERNWFRRVLLKDDTAQPIWYDPADEDSELVPLDDADWEADLGVWEAECQASRDAAAAHGLDDTGIRRGQPCSLRWIYVHMIEEYARHNGHADLLRELADGRVGW